MFHYIVAFKQCQGEIRVTSEQIYGVCTVIHLSVMLLLHPIIADTQFGCICIVSGCGEKSECGHHNSYQGCRTFTSVAKRNCWVGSWNCWPRSQGFLRRCSRGRTAASPNFLSCWRSLTVGRCSSQHDDRPPLTNCRNMRPQELQTF